MKKIVLKIFNVINALITACFTAIMMFYCADDSFAAWVRGILHDNFLYNIFVKRWTIVVLWIFFAIAVLTIYMILKKRGTTRGILVRNEIGECKVTLSAFENIAMAESKRINGIKVNYVLITKVNDGIEVLIRAGTAMDENIPDLQATIQERVKEALEKTTGVKVTAVNVIITEVESVNKPRVE